MAGPEPRSPASQPPAVITGYFFILCYALKCHTGKCTHPQHPKRRPDPPRSELHDYQEIFATTKSRRLDGTFLASIPKLESTQKYPRGSLPVSQWRMQSMEAGQGQGNEGTCREPLPFPSSSEDPQLQQEGLEARHKGEVIPMRPAAS